MPEVEAILEGEAFALIQFMLDVVNQVGSHNGSLLGVDDFWGMV